MRYLARRAVWTILAVLGVSVLIFILVRLLPGNIVDIIAGTEGQLGRAQRAAVLQEFGLDQPLPVQYFRWMANLLHGDLAAQTLTYMRNGSQGSSTKALMSWKMRRPMSVPWTEYSLYTTVAEMQGNLFDYHVEWNTCYGASVHLFSEQSCVWGADDFERLVKLPNGTDPGGKFIIVQSHARIPLERVREYCLSFAG